MNIKLGIKARDKITGFEGIVISRSIWLTGCDQYCLKQKALKNKLPEDGIWFDEGTLEIIGEGITKKEVKAKKNGGPRCDSPIG